MSQQTKTFLEAQQWFVDQGIAVSDWAAAQGFTTALVYAVLHGRRKGLRGQSHRIAVALGLKAAPEGTPIPAAKNLVVDTHPLSKEPSMSP